MDACRNFRLELDGWKAVSENPEVFEVLEDYGNKPNTPDSQDRDFRGCSGTYPPAFPETITPKRHSICLW